MNHLEPCVTSLLRSVLKEVADDLNASSEARAHIAERLLKAARAGITEVERLKELAVEAYAAHGGPHKTTQGLSALQKGMTPCSDTLV